MKIKSATLIPLEVAKEETIISFTEDNSEETEEKTFIPNLININNIKLQKMNLNKKILPLQNVEMKNVKHHIIQSSIGRRLSQGYINEKNCKEIMLSKIDKIKFEFEAKRQEKNDMQFKMAAITLNLEKLKEKLNDAQKTLQINQKKLSFQKSKEGKLEKEQANLLSNYKNLEFLYSLNKENIERILNSLNEQVIELREESKNLHNKFQNIKESFENEQQRLKLSIQEITKHNFESNIEFSKSKKKFQQYSHQRKEVDKLIENKKTQIKIFGNNEK